MNVMRRPVSRRSRAGRWAACACLASVVACAPPADVAARSASSSEWREFQGSWSAAGVRNALRLGPDRQVSIFRLTGSLLLSGDERPAVGFRAQVLGLTDTQS